MPIQVKSLAFVFHAVTDIPRARKFYEGVLGLKVGKEVEFTPGQFWVEYDIDGQALAISNAMPGVPTAALNLEVADLDAAIADAREAGVEIAFEIMDFQPCRIFGIKDPDGNQIGLHQLKA